MRLIRSARFRSKLRPDDTAASDLEGAAECSELRALPAELARLPLLALATITFCSSEGP